MMKGNILGADVCPFIHVFISVTLVIDILLLIIINAVQSGPGVPSEIRATTQSSRSGEIFHVVPQPPPVTTPMNTIKPP